MTTAQDQQSRELLPCPFCGREAMMSHSRDGEVCNVRCAGWSVGNCLGAGPNCYTEADAVAGWNRRAPAVQAARALPAGMGHLPACPFPCGWGGLHKIAVADGAYLARIDWPEDEEGVSVQRAAAMRTVTNLIDVCRAILAATPKAPTP